MAQKSDIEKLADDFAHPNVYCNQSAGYARLSGLGLDEWEEFTSYLKRHHKMDCRYNHRNDNYTIS